MTYIWIVIDEFRDGAIDSVWATQEEAEQRIAGLEPAPTLAHWRRFPVGDPGYRNVDERGPETGVGA